MPRLSSCGRPDDRGCGASAILISGMPMPSRGSRIPCNSSRPRGSPRFRWPAACCCRTLDGPTSKLLVPGSRHSPFLPPHRSRYRPRRRLPRRPDLLPRRRPPRLRLRPLPRLKPDCSVHMQAGRLGRAGRYTARAPGLMCRRPGGQRPPRWIASFSSHSLHIGRVERKQAIHAARAETLEPSACSEMDRVGISAPAAARIGTGSAVAADSRARQGR